MKVILNQTVPKVGKEGQVVNVAGGFARNFLFPRGLATIANRATLKALEMKHQRIEAELEKTRSTAESLAASLDGKTITVTGSTAKGSAKLFGAVTAADIAEAIRSQLGQEVDKKNVALLHPLKRLGAYPVLIALHRDAEATIRVEVRDEEGRLSVDEVVEALPEVVAEPEAPADAETPAETDSESKE